MAKDEKKGQGNKPEAQKPDETITVNGGIVRFGDPETNIDDTGNTFLSAQWEPGENDQHGRTDPVLVDKVWPDAEFSLGVAQDALLEDIRERTSKPQSQPGDEDKGAGDDKAPAKDAKPEQEQPKGDEPKGDTGGEADVSDKDTGTVYFEAPGDKALGLGMYKYRCIQGHVRSDSEAGKIDGTYWYLIRRTGNMSVEIIPTMGFRSNLQEFRSILNVVSTSDWCPTVPNFSVELLDDEEMMGSLRDIERAHQKAAEVE